MTFAKVAAVSAATCGLKEDGTAFCWGNNYWGQLGDGTLVDTNTPQAIQTNAIWQTVVAGINHTLGVGPQ